MARAPLAERAKALLDAHRGPSPLVLLNAWDVRSAEVVEAAGLSAVATSSRAIAQVFGWADDDSADPNAVFAHLRRIASAVEVPVTADLEAGYRLGARELVERILEAGLVGCNLEDSDHHGTGVLVDAERQADFLAEVRAAAEEAGVHLVLNARVDAVIRRVGDDEAQLEEAVRRGCRYLEAGADCVYPIALTDPERVGRLVAQVPGPVNVVCRDGREAMDALVRAGARRISFASGLYQKTVAYFEGLVAGLR